MSARSAVIAICHCIGSSLVAGTIAVDTGPVRADMPACPAVLGICHNIATTLVVAFTLAIITVRPRGTDVPA